MSTKLKEALGRLEAWPEAAQEELAEVLDDIERGFRGVYHATPEELAGIDRGRAAAAASRFATDEEVRKLLCPRRA